jgi:hypothetical protein
MVNISKDIQGVTTSKKTSPAGMSKPASVKSAIETRTASKSNVIPLLTHKQIEEQAKAIWRQRGCPVGQDDKIWLEAEAQLKKELAIK